MIIRMADISAAGHCGLGARRWFEANGFDFRDFMRDGISAELFLSSGDHLAQRVVELKKARENG